MTYMLDVAVEKFLTEGKVFVPPHLINSFLRIMETMERPTSVHLRFNQGQEVKYGNNDQEIIKGQKNAYYEIMTPSKFEPYYGLLGQKKGL